MVQGVDGFRPVFRVHHEDGVAEVNAQRVFHAKCLLEAVPQLALVALLWQDKLRGIGLRILVIFPRISVWRATQLANLQELAKAATSVS